ncbi:hypothetical protein [Algoriphagus aquimarinus]|tara:strand:- start:79 stop:225 length:147 start_codon:yes stop_codon:yes gene_type:complete
MDENEHLSATYPFNEIYEVVEEAIGKGKIDSEEYKNLAKYFKEFLKIE